MMRWLLNAALMLLVVLLSVAVAGPGGRAAADPLTVTVNVHCDQGDTITRALLFPAPALVLVVQGTCRENVVIARHDVTLRAGSGGGAVAGPDATRDTLTVTGDRVTVDGLTVTGGRNGVQAIGGRNVTLHNCAVGPTGRNGVVFFQGATGLVDGCTVNGNAQHGIVIEGAAATVINTTVSQNAQNGVVITNSGSARLGITNDSNAYAGNMINSNGGAGVVVANGAGSSIGGNTVSSNGADPSSALRFGVVVTRAGATLVGGNTITNNPGAGVVATAGHVLVGDVSFGLSPENTISGNGFLDSTTNTRGGLFVFQTGSIDIRHATITGNAGGGVVAFENGVVDLREGTTSTANVSLGPGLYGGHGVAVSLRSVARVRETVSISGNQGAGVYLQSGGAVDFRNGPVITGNSLYGLACVGTEASFSGVTANITGNAPGDIAPSCTGF